MNNHILFSDLGLSDELLRALQQQGYTAPTPIQAAAIPAVLEGKDILAGAQTGTGKTAAFTLPMLQLLQPFANTSVSPAKHPLRTLILTPTRELADQVAESVKAYSQNIPLRSTVVFGGVDMQGQIKALREGVEIVVATPGRLLDHVQQKTINLSQIRTLVLDEADRMLDMGFMPDLKRIMELLPKQRQTLLFSATFAPEIKKLADQFMQTPILIEVAKQNATNDKVEQRAYAIESTRKRELLVSLLKTEEWRQVLVFTRTRQGAERLCRDLKRDGVESEAIHGDKTQQARTAALEGFKQGQISVLVATDVAARGLDIDELPYVVNYELPNTPEDYVHRIGRTGRGGKSGIAISLVSPEEHKQLQAIEKLIGNKIAVQTSPMPSTIGRRQNTFTKANSARTSHKNHDIHINAQHVAPSLNLKSSKRRVAALFLPPFVLSTEP